MNPVDEKGFVALVQIVVSQCLINLIQGHIGNVHDSFQGIHKDRPTAVFHINDVPDIKLVDFSLYTHKDICGISDDTFDHSSPSSEIRLRYILSQESNSWCIK